MSQFWDDKFGVDTYIYGEAPNAFFREQLDLFRSPGQLLLPMEGEGRNAVYAAQKGWAVHAFDSSKVGRKKALKLLNKKGCEIDYRLADVEESNLYPKGTCDAVGLIFSHLPPEIRRQFHNRVVQALKQGGRLIAEYFHPLQLNYSSGGPPNEEMLYSKEVLAEDFRDLEILHLEEGKKTLEEGSHHSGRAYTVRFVGEKL